MLPPAAARARDLTVALPADAPQEVLRKVYLGPFAIAAGQPVVEVEGETGVDALRNHAAAWDVVALPAAAVAPACAAGVLEKLDWQALGGRDKTLPAGVTDCALGAYAGATVLSWDREKFQGTPGWAEFWDIARVPGKRGLRRGPRGTLEIALLADGVAPADIYRTLRSDEGLERAFRRLDQLLPYVVWWEPGGRTAPSLLSSGEVLMTSAPSPAIVEANRSGPRSFGMQWAGSLLVPAFWAIPKGAENLAQAMRFLAFAADPKVQSALPAAGALGGLAKGANDGLSPELLAISPTAPANLNASLTVDEAFWRDNGERIGKRFDAWLSR